MPDSLYTAKNFLLGVIENHPDATASGIVNRINALDVIGGKERTGEPVLRYAFNLGDKRDSPTFLGNNIDSQL